ncbi:MAG: amidase [Pseudomonadota bacterium]
MEMLGASAAHIGREIAASRIDPVELTEAFLQSIADKDPDHGIYAQLTENRARHEAAAARKRADSGMTLSALDGVPVSWKDLYDSAGTETTSGTRLLAGRIPDYDAELLQRASAAGMVCLGKTHQTELAILGLGINEATATPPNAILPGHAPGGSSSGAAASLAFDMASIAMGSDTGGSIRTPACWNHLVGLKTSFGALSGKGMIPLCQSFDTPGPLARTVEDAALIFGILAGIHDVLYQPSAPDSLKFLVPDSHLFSACDETVVAAFENALHSLKRAGAEIHQKPAKLLDSVQQLSTTTYRFESWRQWGELISANGKKMDSQARKRFEQGKDISKKDYLQAQLALDQYRAQWLEKTAEYDAVIWPTVPILPPNITDVLADDDQYSEANLLSLRNTRLTNMLGGCALTLPLSERACGLQIACNGGEDRKLLAIGSAVEPLL